MVKVKGDDAAAMGVGRVRSHISTGPIGDWVERMMVAIGGLILG